MRLTYDAESLERVTREFERAFGVDSDSLYEAYAANDLPDTVPRFEAFVWASFVRKSRRLRRVQMRAGL